MPLGALQAEFTENAKATASTGLIGVGCIAFGAIMLGYFWFDMAGQDLFQKILFVVAGLAAIAGGASCLVTYFKNRGVRVAVHENGLMIERPGKPQTATWDEIESVTEKVEKMHLKGRYVYDRYLYTVTKKNGETLIVSNLISDVSLFGQILRKYVPVR